MQRTVTKNLRSSGQPTITREVFTSAPSLSLSEGFILEEIKEDDNN
jgi:hypothetical protein